MSLKIHLYKQTIFINYLELLLFCLFVFLPMSVRKPNSLFKARNFLSNSNGCGRNTYGSTVANGLLTRT